MSSTISALSADIRKSEPNLSVRNDIHQVKAATRRTDSRLDDALNGRGSRFRIGAKRLLFLSREAAVGVSWGEASVAKGGVVPFGFKNRGSDCIGHLSVHGSEGHGIFASYELAGLFENAC